MKSLLSLLCESDIENLKDKIINKVENSTNIKVLKKVNKYFELTDDEYAEVKNTIRNYFKNRCGWNEKITENVRDKIKKYGVTKLFGKVIESIENNSSNNDNYFTSKKLIGGTNIYALINDYVKSILEHDDNLKNDFDKEAFDKMLQDISSFTLGGKVATGAFEFLSVMFLQDLNPKNEKGETQEAICDVNTKESGGLEYKASGARVSGNKEESKPLSPAVIDKKFIELLKEQIDSHNETDAQKNKNQFSSTIRLRNNLDKDLEQALKDKDLIDFVDALSKKTNLFRNGDPKRGNLQLSSVLEPLVLLGISEDTLNSIVVDSFLAQVSKLKCDDSSKKYLIEKYPIIKDGKSNNNNLRHIFLVLGLCNYWLAEKWNYMILFESIETGNYRVIKAPSQSNIIESMDANIKDIAYSDANPAYGPGTNAQNHAPVIKYKK